MTEVDDYWVPCYSEESVRLLPNMTEESAQAIIHMIKANKNEKYVKIGGLEINERTTNIWRVARTIHFSNGPDGDERSKHWFSLNFGTRDEAKKFIKEAEIAAPKICAALRG